MTDHRADAERQSMTKGQWREATLAALQDIAERLPTKGEPCPCGCPRTVEPKPTGVTEPESDTLVEALDALPEGGVVRDGDGSTFRKHDGAWACGWRSSTADPWSSQRVAAYTPIGIESIPGEAEPEPETMTVTLPRDVVERARGRLLTAAQCASEDKHPFSAEVHLQVARALSDAIADALEDQP